MLKCKKIFVLCAALAGLLLTASCGYRMGSMMHPQIKTIAIADVKNNTMEVLASATMRRVLAECFQTDGSLKLTSLDKADCIVYCRILSVKSKGLTWDNSRTGSDFRPTEYSLSLSGEFTVLIPGQAKPLIGKRKVSGSATYRYLADPAIGRESGLTQACLDMAKMIVQYTTEAW